MKSTYIPNPNITKVTTSNNCIEYTNKMSLKALGLLTILLNIDEDAHFNVTEFYLHLKEGRDAFYTVWKELKRLGFVKQERVGKSYHYTFSQVAL